MKFAFFLSLSAVSVQAFGGVSSAPAMGFDSGAPAVSSAGMRVGSRAEDSSSDDGGSAVGSSSTRNTPAPAPTPQPVQEQPVQEEPTAATAGKGAAPAPAPAPTPEPTADSATAGKGASPTPAPAPAPAPESSTSSGSDWNGSDTCTDDTTSVDSITADFYSYSGASGSPKQGDLCPIPCDSTTYSDSIYLSRADLNGGVCRQWPGASGWNAQNNGQCNGDGDSYSWDQYLSCDCGVGGFSPAAGDGTTATRKTLYKSKCIVDTVKPGSKGICGQIRDYSICDSPAGV